MDTPSEMLVSLMKQNRHRHGKCWEKVRRDRVFKLMPDVKDIELVEQIIQIAITSGAIKECKKECDDGVIPAIKLTTFDYTPKW